MDLSWESLYAQFPGLSSPSGGDGFDVDLFFEKNQNTKNDENTFIAEYDTDNALVHMEETLDLDKLTELSSLTTKDITNETLHLAMETPKLTAKDSTASPENSSALYYYNYEDKDTAANRSLQSSNQGYVKNTVLDSNLNFTKLINILPPDSEKFLQNLLYESEENTFTSREEFHPNENEQPSSPLAVVPNSSFEVEDNIQNLDIEESKDSIQSNSVSKQRIILPKGTIAYTLDLIPGTNTYVITQSTVPVPENINTQLDGTLSNNDLLSLGISSNSYIPNKVEETKPLDTLQVPYLSPVAASPKSEYSWSNSLEVPYSSPGASSPMSDFSSGSDTEWKPCGRKLKRSPEERKMRKMEQNKTAALRYRQKKHEEMSKSQIQKDQLQARNLELKKTAGDLSTELKYIKKLLKEVYQAKGLL